MNQLNGLKSRAKTQLFLNFILEKLTIELIDSLNFKLGKRDPYPLYSYDWVAISWHGRLF